MADKLMDSYSSFILRLSVDEAGRVTGIVERAKTGEKQQFHGVEAIGPLIERMLNDDENNVAGGRP
jgi:hypothetical protein